MDEKLIDVTKVAKMTATSPRTVHRLNSSGRIPRSLKIGGCLRWRASDIDAWIEMGCPRRAEFEAKREVCHA